MPQAPAATTWTLVPILTGSVGDGPAMTHVAARRHWLGSSRGSIRALVTSCGPTTSADVAHAGVDTQEITTLSGLAASHAAATSRQLLQQASKTFSVVRVIYDPASKSLHRWSSRIGRGLRRRLRVAGRMFHFGAGSLRSQKAADRRRPCGPFFESERAR